MQRVLVGLAGATGYVGQELLALLARHPRVTLTTAMSSGAGRTSLPRMARVWDGELVPLSVDQLAEKTNAAFLALPDPVTAEVVPALVERGVRVFDLSGTFRLRDSEQRAKWYPAASDTVASTAVYGLPEHCGDALRDATLVACPGSVSYTHLTLPTTPYV